jgi:hypothetical protein
MAKHNAEIEAKQPAKRQPDPVEQAYLQPEMRNASQEGKLRPKIDLSVAFQFEREQ